MKHIFHNSILRDDLAAWCTRAKLEPKLIKRSVPMQWNSVAEMIESVLYLRIPLDRLVEMDRHNTVAKTRLRKLKILPKEWDILSQLTKVLLVSILLHFALLAADLSQAFPRSNTSTVTKKDSTSS